MCIYIYKYIIIINSLLAMGESEDEYERRRDKFRGERSEYPAGGQPARDRRQDTRRGREDWQDRLVIGVVNPF